MKFFFRYISLLLIISGLYFKLFSQNNIDFLRNTFIESQILFEKGQFIDAELKIKLLIENKQNIPGKNMIAVHNLYGSLLKEFGRYEEAIFQYQISIDIFNSLEEKQFEKLVGIYNNIALVYKELGRYEKSNLYYDNALNILKKFPVEGDIFQLESRILYNKGIVEFNRDEYAKAIDFFYRSLDIKTKYKLSAVDKVYYNLARSFNELNDNVNAEKYFLLCIDTRKSIYGDDYYNLASVYLNYGDFLNKNNDSAKALSYIKRSINLYSKTYGERHPNTSYSLRHLGNYYLLHDQYDSALYYYQRSLIANSFSFNSKKITKNPETEDVIFWESYLSSLKMKSVCLQKLYFKRNKDIRFVILSNKINDLAIEYISKLSSSYISNVSKFNVTEEGRAFYSLAVANYIEMYNNTHNRNYLKTAYHYVYKSKAAVLEEQILKESQIRKELPDEVFKVKQKAEKEIAGYKRLIFLENSTLKPDKNKISMWQSELLNLNNKYEHFIQSVKEAYPSYDENLRLITHLTIEDLQKQISSNDVIVEYFIGANSYDSDTTLYTFMITKNNFYFNNFKIDKQFFRDIDYIFNKMNGYHSTITKLEDYNRTNYILFKMYTILVKPVNKFTKNNNLIIIPDKEISLLSMETLLSEYIEQKIINYSSLSFLIYDYSFSYAYSASMFNSENDIENNAFVYGFAPEYKKSSIGPARLNNLSGAVKEIESILKWNDGLNIVGADADKKRFQKVSKEKGILHFAMHASVDKDQPDFSFLAFSNLDEDDTIGLLYNYEIEMMNIESPLVVLSACNTGSGDIYNGEGIMSLSRSFLHAGVPAVIHSIWNVNDQTGMAIMEEFYLYLSKGYSKSEALRKAKINYLKNASPAAANPYYWAGYILTGDRSPVIKKNLYIYIAGLFLSILLVILLMNRKIKKSNL